MLDKVNGGFHHAEGLSRRLATITAMSRSDSRNWTTRQCSVFIVDWLGLRMSSWLGYRLRFASRSSSGCVYGDCLLVPWPPPRRQSRSRTFERSPGPFSLVIFLFLLVSRFEVHAEPSARTVSTLGSTQYQQYQHSVVFVYPVPHSRVASNEGHFSKRCDGTQFDNCV